MGAAAEDDYNITYHYTHPSTFAGAWGTILAGLAYVAPALKCPYVDLLAPDKFEASIDNPSWSIRERRSRLALQPDTPIHLRLLTRGLYTTVLFNCL